MTEPEMMPSAEERARSWLGLREHRGYDADNIHCASAIAEAFRDGALTERACIVAMLRREANWASARDMSAIGTYLSALADGIASSQDTSDNGQVKA